MTRIAGQDCAVMCKLINTHTQGPVSVHVHRTDGVTESEGWEGANGVGVGTGT